jgi:hypothetical protein
LTDSTSRFGCNREHGASPRDVAMSMAECTRCHAGVRKAMMLMEEKAIRHVPVFDQDNILGVMSIKVRVPVIHASFCCSARASNADNRWQVSGCAAVCIVDVDMSDSVCCC